MAQVFFAKNIKYIRDCLHETQQEMSGRLGTSLKRYQSYEKDNVEPNYEMLLGFSDKIGTNADRLLRENLRETCTELDILRLASKSK